MKMRSPVTVGLGGVLIALGVVFFVLTRSAPSALPALFGGSLIWLGWTGARVPLLVFGHTCIVLGLVMITWGILLLPYSQPTFAHVFGRPLFWGLFSVFGGVCANYHGFCKCIRVPKPAPEKS